MARFYLPPAAWTAAPVLTGEEARHLVQVLRIQPGAAITVFDGHGRRATAVVLTATRDQVTLQLGAVLSPPAPRPVITLAQAIPKGKNMDLIVQKAVELGVAAIQPLVTNHTIVQPADHKAAKWRRNALEACKQCGQDTLPVIAEPMAFIPWLVSQGVADGLRLIASLAPGARPLHEVLPAHPATTAVTLLVGPEGDFSPTETAQALAAGFLPVSLGAITLRVETATIFCLAVLRYEFA